MADGSTAGVGAERVLRHDDLLSLTRLHSGAAQDFSFNKLPPSLPLASALRRISGLSYLQPVGSAVQLCQDLVLAGYPQPQDRAFFCPSSPQVTEMEGALGKHKPPQFLKQNQKPQCNLRNKWNRAEQRFPCW